MNMTTEEQQDEKLIRSIASGLSHKLRDANQEELEQEGRIALWQARDKIPADPKHALMYKRQRVHGAMIDYVRNASWVPRSAFKDEARNTMFELDLEGPDAELQGDAAVMPDNAHSLLEQRDAITTLEKALSKGSGFDREVAKLVLDGMSLLEISDQLNRSKSYINKVFVRIMREIEGVRSRAGSLCYHRKLDFLPE